MMTTTMMIASRLLSPAVVSHIIVISNYTRMWCIIASELKKIKLRERKVKKIVVAVIRRSSKHRVRESCREIKNEVLYFLTGGHCKCTQIGLTYMNEFTAAEYGHGIWTVILYILYKNRLCVSQRTFQITVA